jgi:uncharacterized protein (TIGR00369 family)
MCFVCGLKNHFGLKTLFFETNTNQLIAVFRPREENQGYPGRLHGGVASAILDETIGRAIRVNREEEVWGVTVELKTRYLKPIPLNEDLRVVGRVTKEGSRFFEGTGEVILGNGEIAVTGEGRYLKLPLEKIADAGIEETEWKVSEDENDPKEIQI